MPDPSVSLPLHREDRVLRSVEDLSRHGRIPRGFIRLCLSLGCPGKLSGRLSLAMLLDWLCDEYPAVRAAAGLPKLTHLDLLPASTEATLQMANAMITLLQYSESRASDYLSKSHLALMLQYVERSLDC